MLRWALAISIAVHLLLAAYFLIRHSSGKSVKEGSIAVELIQSVPHGELEDPHKHPGKKAKALAKAPAPSSTAVSASPGTGPTSEYILAVTRLINARRIYPAASVDREEEGRVVVGVTLDREGHVIAVNIEEKAPFDSLNQAAIATVKAVANFPPIPEDIEDPIHLHIPLVFKIESQLRN